MGARKNFFLPVDGCVQTMLAGTTSGAGALVVVVADAGTPHVIVGVGAAMVTDAGAGSPMAEAGALMVFVAGAGAPYVFCIAGCGAGTAMICWLPCLAGGGASIAASKTASAGARWRIA